MTQTIKTERFKIRDYKQEFGHSFFQDLSNFFFFVHSLLTDLVDQFKRSMTGYYTFNSRSIAKFTKLFC